MPSQTTRFTPPNPNDPEQMAQAIAEIQALLDGGISFGHPSNPHDDTSAVLAGATGAENSHNGTLANINGAWAEIVIGGNGASSGTYPDPGDAVTVTHNLGLDVFSASSPNVRWIVAGASHNGAGVPGNAAVTVYYDAGDTVAADSIQLRVGTQGLTVVDATPVTLTLFIIPALRFDGV